MCDCYSSSKIICFPNSLKSLRDVALYAAYLIPFVIKIKLEGLL